MGMLILVMAWRQLCKSHKFQKSLHSLPTPLPFLFQPYTMLIVVFGGNFAMCYGNIVSTDYWQIDWLSEEYIQRTLARKVAEGLLDAAKIDDFKMPDWLKTLSLASTFVGVLAFLIIAIHVIRVLRKNRKFREGLETPWALVGRQDMLLFIIAMPAVYIIMSMRSTSRMWMVMRGFHTDTPVDAVGNPIVPDARVLTDATTDLALYKENFELASICQYWTVFVFSQLCVSFLNEQKAPENMKKAMGLVGFQGVYAWCIVGAIHSVVLFTLAYSHNFSFTAAQLHKVHTAESKIGMMASAMSLLCTYNMLVICKLDYMKRSLPRPSMKFNGTKMLLLLGPNQLKVLSAFTASKNPFAQSFDLSTERAMLIHSSLMCFECLVVVLLNFYAWEIDVDDDNLFKNQVEDDSNAEMGYEKLGS